MENILGTKLADRYLIEELVGVGGMCNVYRAFDAEALRTVAVKMLRDEYAADEEYLRRFRNESRAINALSHPNIVKIYDVVLDVPNPYLVMEYVSGITLKEYIERKKPIPGKTAANIAGLVLTALQCAHENGIVHRDVKPQNIMVTEKGEVKVMDFGIARFAMSQSRTIDGNAIGSVHYISPEQALGDAVDQRTDIYSVGVILFEMLSGRLPFDGESPISVALQQVEQNPKALRSLNPNVPVGLEQITLPARLFRIGNHTFSACAALTAPELPETLRHIGESAFLGCAALDEIRLPDGTESVGAAAFAYCTGLARVTLGQSLPAIPMRSFLSCRALTAVTVPDTVRSIGDDAFSGCTSLAAVTLPAGLESIGDRAFSETAIDSVSFPHRLHRIGSYAFADCHRLATLIFPPAGCTVEKNAFAGCEGIELAVLPDRLPFARRRLEKWRLTPDATLLRHADLRRGGRPAGGPARTGLHPSGRSEKHLRHRLLCHDEHRPDRPGEPKRASLVRGVEHPRRDELLSRGQRIQCRQHRAVDARRAASHFLGGGNAGACRVRAGQRRRVSCLGVHRPRRAVLGYVRARHARRHHPRNDARARCPRGT